jgi:uncharacterized membrane protein YbhN (UPF0104 family)
MESLGDASLPWLVPALAAEALCYLFIAAQVRRLVSPAPGYWLSYRVGLIISGLGSLLPGSPAPGIALSVAPLHKHGVPRAQAAGGLAWLSWYSARALLAIAAVAAVVATFTGELPRRHGILPAALVLLFALALSAVAVSRPRTADRLGALLGRSRFLRRHRTPDELRALAQRWHSAAMAMTGDSRNRSALAIASGFAWLADVACLWFALQALRVDAPITAVLLAYCGGLILSGLPLLPGGLGVVEAAVPTILHHYGVPVDDALAGVLAWRAIGLFLPALAGTVALASFHIPAGRVWQLVRWRSGLRPAMESD